MSQVIPLDSYAQGWYWACRMYQIIFVHWW